jgi:AraC-like DNA-binding protein
MTTNAHRCSLGASIGDISRQCAVALYPTKLDVLGKRRSRVSQRYGSIGPITMGDVTFGRDVRIEVDELGSSYHVNLPLTCHLESRHRQVDVIATRAKAAVYQPDGEITLTRWPADCRLLCVKLDRFAVDQALEAMIGRLVAAPIAFAPSIDLTREPGRSWAQILVMVNDQLAMKESFAPRPMVAAPLADALLRGFLLAAEHPYSEDLIAPVQPIHPAAVRTAIEIIEADPQVSLSIQTLANRCNISVRTLQDGFQRYVGVSPTAYLRSIRLKRAHEELRAADPSIRTVAAVAHAWGFTHLGRFAAAHEARFGELPGKTLRDTR